MIRFSHSMYDKRDRPKMLTYEGVSQERSNKKNPTRYSALKKVE